MLTFSGRGKLHARLTYGCTRAGPSRSPSSFLKSNHQRGTDEVEAPNHRMRSGIRPGRLRSERRTGCKRSCRAETGCGSRTADRPACPEAADRSPESHPQASGSASSVAPQRHSASPSSCPATGTNSPSSPSERHCPSPHSETAAGTAQTTFASPVLLSAPATYRHLYRAATLRRTLCLLASPLCCELGLRKLELLRLYALSRLPITAASRLGRAYGSAPASCRSHDLSFRITRHL